MSKFWISSLLLLLGFTPLADAAQPLPVKPDEVQRLARLKAEIAELSTASTEAQNGIDNKRIEINTIDRTLPAVETEISEIKQRLQKYDAMEAQDPGSVNPVKLSQARTDNEAASERKRALVKKRADAKAAINQLEQTYWQKSSDRDATEKKYDELMNGLIQRVLAARKNEYETPRTVERISGTVSCGEMPVKECKEQSLREAERQAIERGSVIVVQSITEIKNSKLTKDQIRSATRGRISNRTIVEAKFVSDDTAFQTTINAEIIPGLSPELLAEMKTSAKMDIEALVDGRSTNSVPAYTEPSFSRPEPAPVAQPYTPPVPAARAYTPPPVVEDELIPDIPVIRRPETVTANTVPAPEPKPPVAPPPLFDNIIGF